MLIKMIYVNDWYSMNYTRKHTKMTDGMQKKIEN